RRVRVPARSVRIENPARIVLDDDEPSDLTARTSKESSSFLSSRGPLAGTTPVVARVDGQPDLEPQLERLDLAAGTVRRPASAGGTGLDRGTPLPLARATSA